MKTKLMLLALVLIVLFSCEIQKRTSFEEVSAPYIEKYGAPDIEEPDFLSIRPFVYWWWIDIQYTVTFQYSDYTGWSVQSECHYPPGHGNY